MITTINEFRKIYEQSNNITVSIENVKSLSKQIYNSQGDKYDETVFNRIRYFTPDDLGYGSEYRNKPFFVVLKEYEKIIGIAKVGYYSLSSNQENDYSISYFSIDKDYRYNGYARLMCDELFKYAKNNYLEISTSAYTVLGKEQLQKLFNEYAKKYNVVFYDRDDMHDAEYMYKIVNGKKLHRQQDLNESKKESDLIICDVQQNFSKFFNQEYIDQLKDYCKKFNRVFNIYDVNDQQDPIQYDFPNLFNSYPKEYGGEIQEEDFEFYFDQATLQDITDKHNNKTLQIGDKQQMTSGDYYIYIGGKHLYFICNEDLADFFISLAEQQRKCILVGGGGSIHDIYHNQNGECITDVYVTMVSFGVDVNINNEFVYTGKGTKQGKEGVEQEEEIFEEEEN